MWRKLLSVILSVLFAEIFLGLLGRSDDLWDFVPLLSTFSGRFRGIAAYDVFIILALFYLRTLYQYFGISSPLQLRAAFNFLYQRHPLQIGILIATGIGTHIFLWPIFLEIFKYPIHDILNSPDSIRRTVIVLLPFLWLLLMTVLNKQSYSYSAPPSVQPQQTLPPPPNW